MSQPSPFRLVVGDDFFGISVTLPGLQATIVRLTPEQLHALARDIYEKVYS